MKKTYNVILEDKKITGTAEELVAEFRERRFFKDREWTIEEFVKQIQQDVWRLYGLSITIDDDAPLHEKCEALVEQLIGHGLLRKAES